MPCVLGNASWYETMSPEGKLMFDLRNSFDHSSPLDSDEKTAIRWALSELIRLRPELAELGFRPKRGKPA